MDNTRRTGVLLVALAAAGLLFFSVPAWGAGKPPAPAAEAASGLAEARALVDAGRFNEALILLRPLLGPDGGDREEAHFLIGLAAIGAAQQPGVPEDARETFLDAAIAALHAMLVRQPGLVRVRLELARAFFLKGEDDLARGHFERVLAGNPPAGVALNVNRFLAEIRARKRWSVHAGFAFAPNSNIGAASGDRIIYIDGLPFRRDEDDLTSSGVGVSLWAGGEYELPLNDRWRLRAGADVSRREYRGSKFDRMTLSAHAGPRWLIDRDTEASLLAVARRHWLANDPEHRDVGLRIEAHRRLTRRLTANLRASWFDRRYDQSASLDGPVMDVSLSAGYLLTPTLRTDLAAGWSKKRPERKSRRNAGRWVRAGLTAALPWGFTVGGSAALRWTDYEGNWFPYTEDGRPREDLTRIFRLSAHHRAFTLGGFSPRLSLVREDRKSNAQLHDYERTFGELSFVRLF